MVAVGTLTYTLSVARGRAQKLVMSWTSDAAGNVSGTSVPGLNGVITRISTVPAGGGSAPTDNYDGVLNDAEGVDLAAGLLANRDTANTETVYPLLGAGTNVPAVVVGSLTPVLSNCGNVKSGQIIAYLDRG